MSLAEALKPFAEDRMKIEPYPWFKGFRINMDELYTELMLEKVERKLLGEETWSLRTYKDMFTCNRSNIKCRKVLLKADLGMGKTTWDWARGVFKEFFIIFFVALKLVKPGDPIENVIIKQHSELEGLSCSHQKLRAVLNTYGQRVLLILDGLDEHGLGHNEDVLKIIRNQKFLDCRILLSSRPHSTCDIEEYFPSVVRVNGFTEKEARKFVSHFFTDESKIKQIMNFKPSDYREDFPVHKCPILLSILCLLVNKKEVDLLDANITVGDLYFQMVQCLYKKYTIRKGVPFHESELVQALKSVGRLALHTMLSNRPMLQRSEVLKIAGDFALEYGFFAGKEDFRLCTDPAADIYVTYAHRSVEEFFFSFGFIQALVQGLDDGKTVDDILGSDCEKPIFLVNPLVWQFCFWLLTTTKFFDSSEAILDQLAFYAAERLKFLSLNYPKFVKWYPAMEIRSFLKSREVEFFKRLIKKCEGIQVVHMGNLRGEKVKGIVELMSPSLLSNLTVLSIGERHSSPPDSNSNDFTISSDCCNSEYYHKVINILLTNSSIIKRNPQVCVRIEYRGSQDFVHLYKNTQSSCI